MPLLNFPFLLCCDTGHRSVSMSFGEFTANFRLQKRFENQSLTKDPLNETPAAHVSALDERRSGSRSVSYHLELLRSMRPFLTLS